MQPLEQKAFGEPHGRGRYFWGNGATRHGMLFYCGEHGEEPFVPPLPTICRTVCSHREKVRGRGGRERRHKKCSRCTAHWRHGMESMIYHSVETECLRLFGGGGESRTPVRERSTQGLYRCSLRMSFRLRTGPQTGVRQLSRRNSSRTPRKEQTYASPMN